MTITNLYIPTFLVWSIFALVSLRVAHDLTKIHFFDYYFLPRKKSFLLFVAAVAFAVGWTLATIISGGAQ